MQDKIIQEINNFFLEQGLEQIAINGETVFKYKNKGYYLLSRGNNGDSRYYLEAARTIGEAKKNFYEDIGAYSPDVASIVADIKSDILEYVFEKKANTQGYIDASVFKYAT
jgi:hypothetical protein